MIVRGKIEKVDGSVLTFQEETRPSNRIWLWTLDECDTYLRRLSPNGHIADASHDPVVDLEHEILGKISNPESEFYMGGAIPVRQAPPGPPLDIFTLWHLIKLRNQYKQLDSLAQAVRNPDATEQIALSPAFVCILVNQAFRLGRAVREAEIPSDLARTSGILSGASRRQWWERGQKWALELINRYPAGWKQGRMLSKNGLADQISDGWETRGFKLGPVSITGTHLKGVLGTPEWHAVMSRLKERQAELRSDKKASPSKTTRRT